MIPWLLVFTFAAALDWLTTKWYEAANAKQAMRAGALSAVISGLGTFAVVSIVEDLWLILADLAGSFVGSCVGVRYGKQDTND